MTNDEIIYNWLENAIKNNNAKRGCVNLTDYLFFIRSSGINITFEEAEKKFHDFCTKIIKEINASLDQVEYIMTEENSRIDINKKIILLEAQIDVVRSDNLKAMIELERIKNEFSYKMGRLLICIVIMIIAQVMGALF